MNIDRMMLQLCEGPGMDMGPVHLQETPVDRIHATGAAVAVLREILLTDKQKKEFDEECVKLHKRIGVKPISFDLTEGLKTLEEDEARGEKIRNIVDDLLNTFMGGGDAKTTEEEGSTSPREEQPKPEEVQETPEVQEG
jgi:hypothetical protein